MSGGTAHIKVANGRAVVGPSGDGAEKEKLFERKFTLENVALRKTEFALEIKRGENLAADDDVFDVGRVLGDGVDDVVAESFFLIVPGAFDKLVRRVLHEAGENVFTGRRDAGIGEAGNDHINVRAARVVPVFGVVVGALHVLHAGRNGDGAAKMSARTGQAFEIGKRVECEIDFSGRAAKFVAADAFQEIGGQFAGFEEFFEGEMRVDAGGNNVGGEFFAILKGNAAGAAVLGENFADRRFGANLNASFAGGVGNGV